MGCYKWYQSKTPSDVPVRRLSPDEGWTQGSVLAKTLGLEGGGLGGSHIDWRRERVPARTLDPEGGWIVRSHIDWGGE